VLLADWWRATEAYWLPPMELFRRIPVGYGAFGILAGTMTWLLVRLRGPRPSMPEAMRFGALAGLLSGAGTVMAASSILRMPGSILVVLFATIGVLIIGIVLQNLFFPTAARAAGLETSC
jgi:hypothetical protein